MPTDESTPTSTRPTMDYATPESTTRKERNGWISLAVGFALAVFLIGAIIYATRPSLGRATETALRLKCGSNIKQIGIAVFAYANEHQGKLPPDLATLLSAQGMSSKLFICPSGNGEHASLNFTADPAARIAGNLDYIYVGEGLTTSVTQDDPILFERLFDHDHDGGNVLFGDGHVDFFPKTLFVKLLEPLRGTSRLTDEEYNAIVAK